MEATAIVSIKSLALLLAVVRMIHFIVAMLCRPRLSRRGLDGDDAFGGCHINLLRQVLGIAASGGEDN